MKTFEEYMSGFEALMTQPDPPAPYDEPDYYQYAKLNFSRSNRWLKRGKLTDSLIQTLEGIKDPQQWILITEPWCGDAAHSVPFIYKMSLLNPKISLVIEHRDMPPFRIDEYLTNGGKSIPKLIIRNLEGKDLALWGPRPQEAQELFEKMKAENLDFETQKEQLQNWYNKDQGNAMQHEFTQLLAPFSGQ